MRLVRIVQISCSAPRKMALHQIKICRRLCKEERQDNNYYKSIIGSKYGPYQKNKERV